MLLEGHDFYLGRFIDGSWQALRVSTVMMFAFMMKSIDRIIFFNYIHGALMLGQFSFKVLPSQLLRIFYVCTFLGLLALLNACSSNSTSPLTGITKITITSTQTAVFGGTAFGVVGTYDKIQGVVTGLIDPNDPKNQVIPDIALAPVNANGLVEYSAPFYILKPSNMANANGKVFYEMLNRGAKQFGSFNQTGATIANDPGTVAADALAVPTTIPLITAAQTSANPTSAGYPAFLMNKGYTLVWSAWDMEPNAAGTNLLFATLPVAHNPDGSSITGPAFQQGISSGANDNATTICVMSYYSPAPNTTATLTWRQHIQDTPQVIPASGWKWNGPGTCGSPTSITAAPGSPNAGSNSYSLINSSGTVIPFVQSAIYEMSYTAKDPYIAGAGYAAMRDFISFIRYASADSVGNPNPLAGQVKQVLGWTLSQPARLANDFVWLGFNQDMNGKQVFDGLFNWIGGGNGLGGHFRFAQTSQTERNRQFHLGQLESVFPFSYATTTDPLTGKTDGRNVRCTATNTCPKIMNIISANEMWVKTGSLLTTDPSTGLDVVQPDNVRNYFVASANHGNGANPGSAPSTCTHTTSIVDPNPILRALWVALDNWTTNGALPPNSVVPSVNNGTASIVTVSTSASSNLGIGFVPAAQIGYPSLPSSIDQYSGLVTIRNYWNWGANYSKGIIDNMPGLVTGKFYTFSVPKVDQYGNDTGGIITPELVAPYGTSTGWGLRNVNFGGSTNGADGCESSGHFVPFALNDSTKVTGDPRPSVTAMYGSKANWVAKRAAAAQALQAQGFLLPQDTAAYTLSGNNTLNVNQTATSTTPLNTFFPQLYSYSW